MQSDHQVRLSGGTEIKRTPKLTEDPERQAAQVAYRDPAKALLLPRGSEGPPALQTPPQQSRHHWRGPQQTPALQDVTDPGKQEESTASRERRESRKRWACTESGPGAGVYSELGGHDNGWRRGEGKPEPRKNEDRHLVLRGFQLFLKT